ncbi:MAG: ribokinase [Polyangiaceae bacterium]|nr:ribokinase [Polyangiaceae bacterium]
MARVVVVGSLNCDFVVRVARRPETGETIMGNRFDTFVGGKGNNQAIACARAGAEVSMVGRIGDDAFGETISRTLRTAGVRCDHLVVDADAGTGIADIQVDDAGNNAIVVVPRANAKVTGSDVDAAAEAIDGAAVVLLQLEIPLDAVAAAARRAKAAAATVILNPAPAPADGQLPEALLRSVDIIVPNESEARALTGIDAQNEEGARSAAKALQALGVARVVLTLGERGVLVADDRGMEWLPAFRVHAVDTTAAGDAFCGALAARLAGGLALREAASWAAAAGALACTRHGAEPSLPMRAEIDDLARRGHEAGPRDGAT